METRIDISDTAPAITALEVLSRAGWQGWLVGGWVRDSLMGRPAHDADIATNAPWQRTAQAFRAAGFAVHETGTAHGTVTAMVDGEPIEITTYRIEGPYSDARHPDYVRFVDSIELDLARRDFTINAIAFHPQRGIVDPFGGMADIKAGVIRAVGDARSRFAEDPLRILRAARFASQLGFNIEGATEIAAHKCAPLLGKVARERVGSEMTKLLLGDNAQRVIEDELGIVSAAIPELAPLRGFQLKSRRHSYDLLGHLAHAVKAAPRDPALRWAALLHDAAKPHAHHDHAVQSARLARSVMGRLCLGRRITDQACDAIAWHETPLPTTERAVQTFVACLGGDVSRARRALQLQESDAIAHGSKNEARVEQVAQQLRMLDSLASQGAAFSVKDLKIDGRDVAQACSAQGAKIGQTLDALLAAVINGQVENEKQALLSYIPTAFEDACEKIFQKRLEKFLTQR